MTSTANRLQASREANQAMKVYFLEVGEDNRAQLSCFGSYAEVIGLYNMAACLLVGYIQRMLELDTSITNEKKGKWRVEGLPQSYRDSLRLAQTPDDHWADALGFRVWCGDMVHYTSAVSGAQSSYKAMGCINLRIGAGNVSYRLPRTTQLMSAQFISLNRMVQRALELAKQEGIALSNTDRLLAFTEKLKNAETMLVLEDNEVSL